MCVTADYDGGWKEALELYLRPLLELCLPAVASRIDWRQPLEWLHRELQQVVREAELGKQWVEPEEEKRMPYVTSYERIARQEGRQERAGEDVLAVLEARFGEVPYELREQVRSIRDETRLRQLLRVASVAPNHESFRAAAR